MYLFIYLVIFFLFKLSVVKIKKKRKKKRTDEVDRSSDHVSNNNVEVSMSNDFIAGRLNSFSPMATLYL